ncbi:MAG: alanine--tRNA ligase [Ichthyobacteriaceae bacterium]|nr:alanine--tRNA ligase [Ichthyobacteriaceae bacterium]
MKSQDIRSTFLDFFNKKNHLVVSSAPLVLKDDPTLMFINAGMNQFKDLFLGHGTPKSNRITDTQKCLRVSGKHNDLEEVGVDTYHHTLFEMLGNWSFGDYFKKEAIEWAWELLTEVYKIDKNNLYVTVFEGDKKDGTLKDTEAYNLWKNLISEDRILDGNKKDNFWEMGAQGPCGPCSEIHVDIRSEEEKAKVDGKTLINEDHPHVIEIWNLVFMQYNRTADGKLEDLPLKHVDTGMGFERLAMVLQGKQSNYDTDIFVPLINLIDEMTKFGYGDKEETDIAMRVIADHVRAVSFAIADGQLPSNTGAGYVIRRILRRAVRYGFSTLEIKEPFIYKLVDILVNEMGETFPEIKKQESIIKSVIKEEESSFLRTLEQGLKRVDQIINQNKTKVIEGSKAFELYDTFGFPLDLTALILKEKGFDLDIDGFNTEMLKQKERARSASKIEAEDWVIVNKGSDVEFVGYDSLNEEVSVLKYRKVKTKKESFYQIVLNKTPFYPEGGGQVGDVGVLELGDEVTYITNTKKENNQIIHISKELPNNINANFIARVNSNIRNLSASNHSATHILHHVLRKVLGNHVEQKGSLVTPNNLRFDFSHFSKLSTEELKKIENQVNYIIRANINLVEKRDITPEQAIKDGALALFGEKYGDKVRTIQLGDSIELCGGTHVKNTSEIWSLKILSESSVASGIRRIEAITSKKAEQFYNDQINELLEVKNTLKSKGDTVKSIVSLQEENSALKKQVEELVKDKAKNLKQELKNSVKIINGANFISAKVDLDAGAIKNLAFEINGELDNVFQIYGSNNNGKAILTIMISKSLSEEKNLNAGQMVRELGKYIQGGGGGQAFFATAGGKNPEGLDEALLKAEELV